MAISLSFVDTAKTAFDFALNLFSNPIKKERTVKGQLVHYDGAPLKYQKIHIWDDDHFVNDFLTTGVTDENGKFSVQFKTGWLSIFDRPDIFITISKSGFAKDKIPFFSIKWPKSLNDVTQYDFGRIVVPYWEYMPGFLAPLIYTSPFVPVPEDFALPLVGQMTATSGFYMSIYNVHRALAKDLSAQEVQLSYPENLTMEMEKERPGSSRSDAFLIDSILNGFAPALLSIDKKGDYHLRYQWDTYEFDGQHRMPNVHAVLQKNSQGEFSFKEISYQFRKSDVVKPVAGKEDLEPLKKVKPNQGQQWEQAKQYFRSAQFLYGELFEHLGKGHVNVGQFAIAFNRTVQENPIAALLSPHLKGVTPINDVGKGVIFGDGSVIKSNSPLTSHAIEQALRDSIAQSDWKGWKPREPLNDQHRYAEIQWLYWEILEEYVQGFIDQKRYSIKKYWREIFDLSETLFEHSVAYQPLSLPEEEQWTDTNEIIKKQTPDKALSKITTTPDLPKEEDFEQLKEFCVYVIYHATLWHAWRNDEQLNYGGEAAYAALSTNPSPIENSYQLFIVNALVRTRYGYITKNEEGDIPRQLIEKLRRQKHAFRSLNYNVDEIRSKINI